jgi:hypothetical protein
LLRTEVSTYISWYRIFKKEHTLRRNIGIVDEVTGGWRKLLNEEHRNLYSSPGIIRLTKSRQTRLRWTGHIRSTSGEERNAYEILVRKPECKRPPRKAKS